MKILVTGGLGFVGGYLVTALLEKGHEVTVLDNLSRNRERSIALWDRLDSDYRNRFMVIWGDVMYMPAVEAAVEGQDVVFHLAGVVSVRESVEDPRRSTNINLGGTLNVAEACRTQDVDKIILASTIAVYGRADLPYVEESSTNPLSPYGLSKLASEHILRIFGELYRIRNISLRFSNIYGGGGAGVINVFIDRIRRGEPVTVFGGSQVDDFVHVSDVVDAYVRALEHITRAPDVPWGYDSRIFNIGSGETASPLELVEILERITGRYIVVDVQSPRRGEITKVEVSWKKAQEILGYRPRFRLEGHLKEMWTNL